MLVLSLSVVVDSYKESSDEGQEDGEDNKMETQGPVLSTEDDNREKIDRVRAKCTVHVVCMYVQF